MNKLIHFAKQSFTVCTLLILSLGMPAAAFADATSAPANSPASVVPTPTPTPTATPTPSPTVSPSADPTPVTSADKSIAPAATAAPEYTYNQQTGLWDSNQVVPVSVATPPSGAITHGGPAALSVASNAPLSPASATSITPASMASNTPPTTTSQAAKQNPSNSDATTTTNRPTKSVNLTTGVTLGTTVNSAATTGEALLQDNKQAGNATTGDASAAATVLNLLQSSASLSGAGFTTFTKDITGDVVGNILVDPAAFAQPAVATSDDLNNPSSAGLAVNSAFSGTIQNDISLDATSGNALIKGNKKAGDATTGSASAVASVLNLINSVVAANQSFVGTINIYGDLTGDILVPADALQALVAGNIPANPDGAADATAAPGDNASDASASSTLTTNSNQNIANNVDLSAVSGDATLANNKHDGNASSGSALTKLTILNLTGHQVTAANSLLVFVNVLGTWVGVIMDAPTGTTAAALTGGAMADTATMSGNGNGSATAAATNSAAIQLANTTNIINNITAHAQSGNATISGNKRAGSATTGNATASASIANIMNSSFSLSHWFGVLFINVFGAWHGNFGTAKPTIASDTGSQPAAENPVQAARIFSFVPAASGGSGLSQVAAADFGNSANYNQFVSSVGQVLAAHDVVRKFSAPTNHAPTTDPSKHFSLSVLPIAVGVTGLTVVGAERLKSIRNRLSHYRVR